MNPADSLAVRFTPSFLGGGGLGSYNSCLLFIHVAAMKRQQTFFVFFRFFSTIRRGSSRQHILQRGAAVSQSAFVPPPQMYSRRFNNVLSRGGRAEGFFFPPSSLHHAVKCSGPSREKKWHPSLQFCFVFFSLTTPSSPPACVTVRQSPSSRFTPLTRVSDVSLTKCDHHRAPAEGERD